MSNYLWEIPHNLRARIAATLREHQVSLTEEISSSLVGLPGMEPSGSRRFSSILVSLFASASEAGGLDQSRGVLHDFCQVAGELPVRVVMHSIYRAERLLVDELALDENLGAGTDQSTTAVHAIRCASFEIAAAYAERGRGMTALRDPLTTLISQHVFRLALEQETERANRHGHGISMLLFDIDNLSEVNKSQGFGAGDRLLERLGISARRFFRTHDWVARHRDDAIAVLLPETALDQATSLANRFREMVHQRLVLVDHKTDGVVTVTVSAAAVGSELVQSGMDGEFMITQAEAAVLRVKLEGGNRTERVAIQPTTVTRED